jgi:hypothetical protein
MRRLSIIAIALISSLCAVPVLADADAAQKKLESKLEETASQAAPLMERIGEVHFGQLAQRSKQKIEVQLDRARCYTFVVVGSDEVTDISLKVTARGEEVTSDRITGERPVAKWCSPGRVKASVEISMYDGSGPFAMAVFGDKATAPRKAEKVGGPGNDFIANRVRQLHSQFGKSRAAISPLYKGNLSTGNEQVFKVRLRAGHCYTIIAAGSPSVRNLDVYLLDGTGRELGKDKSKNSFPTLDTDPCLRSAGEYRVKVKMFSGFGQFGVQVFSD